jgi:hypothetical protein
MWTCVKIHVVAARRDENSAFLLIGTLTSSAINAAHLAIDPSDRSRRARSADLPCYAQNLVPQSRPYDGRIQAVRTCEESAL